MDLGKESFPLVRKFATNATEKTSLYKPYSLMCACHTSSGLLYYLFIWWAFIRKGSTGNLLDTLYVSYDSVIDITYVYCLIIERY